MLRACEMEKLKKDYRITELKNVVPPMYELEERKKRLTRDKHADWRHVCLSDDLGILEGILDDIIRETLEKRHGICK